MTKHNFFIKSANFSLQTQKNINVAVFLPPNILDQDIYYQKERPKWVKKMLGFLGIVTQTTNTLNIKRFSTKTSF